MMNVPGDEMRCTLFSAWQNGYSEEKKNTKNWSHRVRSTFINSHFQCMLCITSFSATQVVASYNRGEYEVKKNRRSWIFVLMYGKNCHRNDYPITKQIRVIAYFVYTTADVADRVTDSILSHQKPLCIVNSASSNIMLT